VRIFMRRQAGGAAQAGGAVLAGIGIGLAMLVRTTAVVVAPILLFVIWRYTPGTRRWRLVAAAAAPLLAAGLAIGLYNWARFGSPLNGGYGNEAFRVAVWVGMLGMLFAPGRSLFIYAPIMLVCVPGLWLLRRPAGLRTWLIGAALAMLAVHGAWWSWWGAWAWGPRYLVAVLPVLSMGLLGLGMQRPAVEQRPAAAEGAPNGPIAWRTPRWQLPPLAALAGLSALVQIPGLLVYRTAFFWDVMKEFPNANPDEVSLYTFRYFMPLVNLQEALAGNLDTAWKPGPGKPLDATGLLLALAAAAIAVLGLVLAWRGGRRSGWGTGLCSLAVAALVLGSLAHYQTREANPFRPLDAAIEAHVASDALVLVGDPAAQTSAQRWNVSRSTRRVLGAARDPVQLPEYTLPVVRRAAGEGRQIWYVQSEAAPPPELAAALRELQLCPIPLRLNDQLSLVRWQTCVEPETAAAGGTAMAALGASSAAAR